MPGLNVMLFMNKFITKPLEYISQSPLKVIGAVGSLYICSWLRTKLFTAKVKVDIFL